MKEIIIVADYTEEATLNSAELCEAFAIDAEVLQNYVAFDILQPQGDSFEDWVFDMAQIKRLRTALRLQHDLEVNHAGIALVMQLLEERESLQEYLIIYHRHILR